jgi:hypothetical protein
MRLSHRARLRDSVVRDAGRLTAVQRPAYVAPYSEFIDKAIAPKVMARAWIYVIYWLDGAICPHS